MNELTPEQLAFIEGAKWAFENIEIDEGYAHITNNPTKEWPWHWSKTDERLAEVARGMLEGK